MPPPAGCLARPGRAEAGSNKPLVPVELRLSPLRRRPAGHRACEGGHRRKERIEGLQFLLVQTPVDVLSRSTPASDRWLVASRAAKRQQRMGDLNVPGVLNAEGESPLVLSCLGCRRLSWIFVFLDHAGQQSNSPKEGPAAAEATRLRARQMRQWFMPCTAELTKNRRKDERAFFSHSIATWP